MLIEPHPCKCGNTEVKFGCLRWPTAEEHYLFCHKCGATGPHRLTKFAATNAWNNQFIPENKKIIDFNKLAEAFHPGQIEGLMCENNWTRECTLLYLWFYNNVGINWKKDVKEDNGRGMYRKYAEAISSRLLEDAK